MASSQHYGKGSEKPSKKCWGKCQGERPKVCFSNVNENDEWRKSLAKKPLCIECKGAGERRRDDSAASSLPAATVTFQPAKAGEQTAAAMQRMFGRAAAGGQLKGPPDQPAASAANLHELEQTASAAASSSPQEPQASAAVSLTTSTTPARRSVRDVS